MLEELGEDTSNMKLATDKVEDDHLAFNPIEELELQVDPNDKKDMDELRMILMGILNYPSDTLA